MASATTSSGTSHSWPLSDLAEGIKSYYIRCKNSAGDVNTDDYTISFAVTSPTCAYSTKASCEGIPTCHWCNISSSCAYASTTFVCQSNADCGYLNDSCTGNSWSDYNGNGIWDSALKTCSSCMSCSNPVTTIRSNDSVWCSKCDSSAPSTNIFYQQSTGTNISITYSDNCNATVYYIIDNGATQLYSSPLPALTGIHNYTYWATDMQGNIAPKKTAILNITPSGTNDSTIDSSVLNNVNDNQSNLITTIKTIEFTPEAPVKTITLSLKISSAFPSVTVKELSAIPVSPPQEKVYTYLNITKENFSNSDIDNATIEFKVDKTWIENNNIRSVYLARYENAWGKLMTETVGSENDYKIYKA